MTFSSALYRTPSQTPLEMYDAAINAKQKGEQGSVSSEVFGNLIEMMISNAKEMREADELESQRQSSDASSEYRKESKEYKELEKYNHESEMKSLAVQQEMLQATIQHNDFSPGVTSSNNEGAGNGGVLVEQHSARAKAALTPAGFSFGEIDSSTNGRLDSRSGQNVAGGMVAYIEQSQQMAAGNSSNSVDPSRLASKGR
ncbi:hypothetical protein [Marinobacterium arenosum]|uniref:hypothetical protein n=1 Tax=Marinobacterium arenosum TaxID=2862496 RepID=UPI001C964400|nr:hypothetical protein [Marinobacterium arenosum]MBY4678263.1 hypothetical protein [Marinobacterium arenosum]